LSVCGSTSSTGATFATALLAGLLAALLGASTPTAARAAAPAPPRIDITLLDTGVRLSPATVPVGAVTLRITNRARAPLRLVAAGKRTPLLAPGRTARLVVRYAKAGRYRFRVVTARGTARTTIRSLVVVAPRPAVPAVALVQVATVSSPTFIIAAPGDPSRLVVTQQDGLVALIKDGALAAAPFLDLRDVTREDGEKGLLSLAFAPDYADSGLLYVFYTDLNGDIVLAEHRRDPDDPDRALPNGRRVLTLSKFAASHNGGMLEFGPDGLLYVSIGDGGAALPDIPPGRFAGDRDTLFGSILRIDPRGGDPYAIPSGNPFVDAPDARSEIVAYGLRNPWRFSIDPATRLLVIGDVGEDLREEVNVLPLDELGLDFGWPCLEGTVTPPTAYRPPACNTASAPPVFEYAHSPTRCSITGGLVARDPRLPALAGRYLFADFCDGRINALSLTAKAPTATPLPAIVPKPTSFGTDAVGRIYVASADGPIYRLDPAMPQGGGT
jgi:glucose/arabinose dehydrogenase